LIIFSRCDDDGNSWVEILIDTIGFLGDGESGGGFGMGGGVEGLVDVGLGLEVLDANIGDVLFVENKSESHQSNVILEGSSYRDVEVCVHQSLEIKVLFAFVADLQCGLQGILCKGDTVNQPKLTRPRLTELLSKHRV
jgi:hypothetical protein